MTEAMGPIWAGGTQSITKSGYTLVFVPDINNNQLQQENKPAVYYWLPNEVRLARKGGDNGDYKFSFIFFEGDDADANGGTKTAGGLLGFSTTSAPPGSVLQEAQDDLLSRFRGSNEYYWGWRNAIAPTFAPAPIVSNTTTVTNLSPTATRSYPSLVSTGANRPRALQTTTRTPAFTSPRTYSMNEATRGSNLDIWYANVQGQGSGSVVPTAENAYSGLVGTYPAALLWTSFHGGTSAVAVWQDMKIKVWSPVVHLKLEGHWQRIQEHFSAAAHAGGLFWSADIQLEFNSLVADGTIKVTTQVDQTIPNAEKIADELNKTKDLIFSKFMDAAQKMIFDPAAFNEKPAEASGGFLGFGGGAAFKLRRDTVTLDLSYDEEQQFAYLQDYPISGLMDGLSDAIKNKNDPTAEKRYFTRVYLGDFTQDVTHSVQPVVNYPDKEREWVGEPVAFVSAQIGYPNVDGTLAWDAHLFQAGDQSDQMWNWKKSKKALGDVTNPPANWQPDQTFIKRQIHLTEPPSEFDYPFVRMQVEKNVIDLDPGVNGQMLNDIPLEVRADSAGTLSIGPISLGVTLTDATQNVEVTFRALGKDDNGNDRVPVKLLWKQEDQDKDRFWMIYTGQLDFVPSFQYKVRVVVKGDLFSNGMEWEDQDWRDGSGNGPLIVSVPKRDSTNVVTRSLPSVVTGAMPASTTSTGSPVGSPNGAPTSTAHPATSTSNSGAPIGSPNKSKGTNGTNGKNGLSVLRGYPLQSPKGTPKSAPPAPAGDADDAEYDIIVPSFD